MIGTLQTISDGGFWEWLSRLESDSNSTQYLHIIRKAQMESDYLLDLLKAPAYEQKSSDVFDKLSLYMPRQYFLEVDFCAKTYATIFSRVFPPLMARVGELAYTEWLLYTEPDNIRYRDHLVHMFKVAYTEDLLLSKIEGLRSKVISCQFQCSHFKKWCDNRKLDISSLDEDEKGEIVDLASFFAGLFHDFGYGYYFHCQYKKRLFKLYEWILPAADPTDTGSQMVQVLLQSLACEFVKNNHAWLRENRVSDVTQASVVSGFLHDCLPLNH
jgi:hypothetical protein